MSGAIDHSSLSAAWGALEPQCPLPGLSRREQSVSAIGVRQCKSILGFIGHAAEIDARIPIDEVLVR